MTLYRIDAGLEKSKCICVYLKCLCKYPHETAKAESAWLALVCMYENSHVQSSVPATSSQAPPPHSSPASSSRATSRNWAAHRHLLPATVSCYTAGLPMFVCLFIFVVYFFKPTLSGHIACVHFLYFFHKTTLLACFYFSFVSSLLQDHIHNIAGSLLLQWIVFNA